METRLKESQSQLAAAAKRVTELEQALEGAAATQRARREGAAGARSGARRAEGQRRGGQAAGRDSPSARTLEAQAPEGHGGVGAKHKAEIERREQVKAQEVQAPAGGGAGEEQAAQGGGAGAGALQEQAGRRRHRGPGRPTGTARRWRRALAGAARSAGVGEEDESTQVNTVPADVKPARRRRPAPLRRRPPGRGQAGLRPRGVGLPTVTRVAGGAQAPGARGPHGGDASAAPAAAAQGRRRRRRRLHVAHRQPRRLAVPLPADVRAETGRGEAASRRLLQSPGVSAISAHPLPEPSCACLPCCALLVLAGVHRRPSTKFKPQPDAGPVCDEGQRLVQGTCRFVCHRDGDCAAGQRCNLLTGSCEPKPPPPDAGPAVPPCTEGAVRCTADAKGRELPAPTAPGALDRDLPAARRLLPERGVPRLPPGHGALRGGAADHAGDLQGRRQRLPQRAPARRARSACRASAASAPPASTAAAGPTATRCRPVTDTRPTRPTPGTG